MTFGQQTNNETLAFDDLNFSSTVNDRVQPILANDNNFFSFFFKASGGIVYVDNNVFYSSILEHPQDPGYGFIQQVISVSDLTNTNSTIKIVHKDYLESLKQLALIGKFFDTNTFLSNGTGTLNYSLYMAIGKQAHTIVWSDTKKDVPNNLRELVDVFIKTCNNLC